MERKNVNVDLPILKEVDVVVAGGGCAGSMAALAAARNGAKTLLIERSGVLGGNMSQGLVFTVHGYRSDSHYRSKRTPAADWSNPLVVPKSSICMEFYNTLLDNGGTAFPDRRDEPSLRENVDEEAVVYTLDQMMKASGVEVLFNTFVFDVIKEGETVTGVVVANKSGAQIIKAKVVIDCSADGDVAASAGCEYLYGEPDTGRTHGISVMSEVGGIDIERFFEYLKNRKPLTPEEKETLNQDIIELCNGGTSSSVTKFSLDGKNKGAFSMEGKLRKENSYELQEQDMRNGLFVNLNDTVDAEWIQWLKDHPYPETPYMLNTTTPKPIYPRAPGMAFFGLVRDGKMRYDQTMMGAFEILVSHINDEEISKALILGREINWIHVKFFRERIPGFENCYLIKNASYGGRESRQIIGEYVLQLSDLQNGVIFEDNIAFCWRANNRHYINGQKGLRQWFEPDKPFSFPYRTLVPKTVDGLLVAGRCISKDVMVRCSSMVPCMQLGEAAGVAAGLAVKENILPRNVNVKEVQEILHLDECREGLGLPPAEK